MFTEREKKLTNGTYNHKTERKLVYHQNYKSLE